MDTTHTTAREGASNPLTLAEAASQLHMPTREAGAIKHCANRTITVKTALSVAFAFCGIAILLVAAIGLSGAFASNDARVSALNVELQEVQASWVVLDAEQSKYNAFYLGQKAVKEAKADYLRAEIDGIKGKEVFTMGK